MSVYRCDTGWETPETEEEIFTFRLLASDHGDKGQMTQRTGDPKDTQHKGKVTQVTGDPTDR